MKKLDVQVAQTAASFKRQDGVLLGMTNANPKRAFIAILVRDEDDVWKQLDTQDELELTATKPVSTETPWCRSTPICFPWKTTFNEYQSSDTNKTSLILNSNVDRHNFPIETVSTFDREESTKLDTDGSTSSESFE